MIRPITASALAAAGVSYNGGGDKMAVPVQPASYIYSHFKHVSGFPAPDGVEGVSVNKLKILDSLIERLSQIKQRKMTEALSFGGGGDFGGESSGDDGKRLDALISALQKELKSASAASANIPYIPKPQIDAGSFVNVSV